MGKLYKRDGRRFVEIVNNEGKYYQKDGTFSNVRTPDSIGLCIISNIKEHVIIALDCDEVEQDGKYALDDCIPSITELSIAYLKFRNKINFIPGCYLTKERLYFRIGWGNQVSRLSVRNPTGMLLGTLRIPI